MINAQRMQLIKYQSLSSFVELSLTVCHDQLIKLAAPLSSFMELWLGISHYESVKLEPALTSMNSWLKRKSSTFY